MSTTSATSIQKSNVPALLMVLVLCLGAYMQFTVASRSEFSNPLVGDAGRYFSYAFNVEQVGVYSQQATLWDPTHDEGPIGSDKVRAPGYPAFLMAVSRPEPTLAWAHGIFRWQALLGVLTLGFTLLLAQEVLPPGWAICVGLLTAVSPHLTTITAEILTESLFTLALVASTWLTVRSFRRPGVGWAIGAGLAWGIATLVRPTAEFFPPLLLAAVLLIPSLRSSRKPALCLFATFVLVLAPWWARNQVSDLRPTSENLTVNFLHHGSYPDFMLEGRQDTLGMPYRYDPDTRTAGASIGGALASIAHHFREEPVRYAHWYLIGKPTSFLSWNIVGGWGDIFTVRPDRSPYFDQRFFDLTRVLMRALHAPLMWLGLAGIVLALRSSRTGQHLDPATVVAAVMAYAIVLHMIGAPYPRYGIPFRPLMYVLALVPLSAAVARWRVGGTYGGPAPA